jgi:serine/threonine protein kinase
MDLVIEASSALAQEHTLIGKVIGNRYRILREVGSGGMAWVYLAEDNNKDHLVAIKILYPQFSQDISYVQRFNREAKLASTLTDPHIVRVLDYGADRDIQYLVMEYIEGRDLREMLEKNGPLPWKQTLEIVDQLATALEHAHQHGVVHRDIKPQNMMTTDDGLLKVLDFGIARIPTLPSLTQSGFIGSPYYVSPEQAMGEETDTRSDIYSAGIVLYELLSGTIPFDARSPWSIINQHISSEPPPIDFTEKNVPDEVCQLLNKMVAKRPENRFPNPGALRRAINAILAGESIPDNALDTQPITPPDKKALANNLYQRSLQAMDTQEWGRAVDLLNQTLNLHPNHPEATDKLIVAEQKSFLVSLYNAGKRAIKSERWEEAINSLNGVLELDPDYNDTAELLSQARTQLETFDTEQLLQTLYNEGIAHLEAQRRSYAIEAFEKVQKLSPQYKDVDQLLATAKREEVQGVLLRFIQSNTGRWGMIIGGIIVIFLLMFTFMSGTSPSAGDNDTKQQLKNLYTQVQQAIEENKPQQALTLLDQILTEDPDYADAAALKRELTTTPTPEPTVNPLATLLTQAEEAVTQQQWTNALDNIDQIRQVDAEFEATRISSLFCDATVGRGLDRLSTLTPDSDQQQLITAALDDFQAGADECLRRTDLQEQTDRATSYLAALNTPPNDYDTLIELLTPIVAAAPNYAQKNARNLLYATHVQRGDNRKEVDDIVGALSDYETALALKVDDPSQAQMHRAELLVSMGQQTSAPPPAIEPTPAPITTTAVVTADSTVTPQPAHIKYSAPILLGPENDTIFGGKFAELFLEWESINHLASDEYYDLTVMHIFADEPTYWGTATHETRIQLSPDIGVGKAGGDRFYWWVTVRKANSAPTSNSLDLPVSRQSEGRTFIWVP